MYAVIRYDVRAHGQSETATAPFSNLDDLSSLLDELKVRKATLIGLSAGSTSALDFALQTPDRVEEMVLAGQASADTFNDVQRSVAAKCLSQSTSGKTAIERSTT